MAHTPRYTPGDYLMDCDECGFTYRRSEIRKRYDGAMVCKYDCWEPKHPQEQRRRVRDRVGVSPARHFNHPTAATNACSIEGSNGKVGVGVVGCMTVGKNFSL